MCLYACISFYTQAKITFAYSIENPDFARYVTSEAQKVGIDLDASWVDQKLLKVRLIQSAESGARADVILVPADHLGMDEFVDYSVIPDSYSAPQINPLFANSGEVEGQRLGIPVIGGNHLVLYYNKSFVDEPPLKWQTIEEHQKGFNTPIIGWSFMEMFWFIPFVNAFGDSPVVSLQPNLDTQSMRKALNYVWGLAERGIVDANCDYACNEERFLTKQTHYSINGMWAYNRYKDRLGDELGVAPLPSIDGKPMKPYSTSFVIAFPGDALNSNKRDELLEFITLLHTPEVQQGLWQLRVGIPVRQDVYEQLLQSADADAKVFLSSLKNTELMPNTRGMMIIWEVLLKGFTRFGSGAMNAQQASLFMQRLAERSIATQEQ